MKKTHIIIATACALTLSAGLLWTVIGEKYPATQTSGQNATPYQSGPFRIGAEVKPERPVVGDNQLHLVLRDEQGAPVTGADISAIAEMPAMGAMPAMRAPADMQEVSPGIYQGEFELAMEGAWPLTLRITKDGLGSAQISFDMASGRAGLRLSSGAVLPQTTPGQMPVAQSILVDAARRQRIGLTTEIARIIPIKREIRAYGEVVYDARRLFDISLKYDAWIEDLRADYIGADVKAGDVLFTFFAPELHATQQEYLDAIRKGTPGLKVAAAQRLGFWGMTPAQIAQLGKDGRVWDKIPYLARQSGVIIEKPIVDGSGVRAGMTLLRIADLTSIWIEADVYEGDLSHITPDMGAQIHFVHGAPGPQHAVVDFIHPTLNRDSRTARVRFTLSNPEGRYRPGMYADIKLYADLGENLAVPYDAVLVSGETRFVFEDLGDGRLAPRQVVTGEHFAEMIEIVSGLEPGAAVVTSGNFLIASETKLKTGIRQW